MYYDCSGSSFYSYNISQADAGVATVAPDPTCGKVWDRFSSDVAKEWKQVELGCDSRLSEIAGEHWFCEYFPNNWVIYNNSGTVFLDTQEHYKVDTLIFIVVVVVEELSQQVMLWLRGIGEQDPGTGAKAYRYRSSSVVVPTLAETPRSYNLAHGFFPCWTEIEISLYTEISLWWWWGLSRCHNTHSLYVLLMQRCDL